MIAQSNVPELLTCATKTSCQPLEVREVALPPVPLKEAVP